MKLPRCAHCEEQSIGCNDDGDYLCEDCMFDEMNKIPECEEEDGEAE